MGQIFGIYAKKEEDLISELPLKTEEESLYSLANIFKSANEYINRILKDADLEQERKDWLQLNEEEELALKYNNIQDFADEEIEYKESMNQPLEKDFYAIGMAYNSDIGEIVYSDEYKKYENWSETAVLSEAMIKIKEVLFEDVKITIESKNDSEYIKRAYDNINVLIGIVKTLKSLKKVDKVALVYGPY